MLVVEVVAIAAVVAVAEDDVDEGGAVEVGDVVAAAVVVEDEDNVVDVVGYVAVVVVVVDAADDGGGAVVVAGYSDVVAGAEHAVAVGTNQTGPASTWSCRPFGRRYNMYYVRLNIDINISIRLYKFSYGGQASE